MNWHYCKPRSGLVLVAAAVIAGCGPTTPPLPPLVTVQGKVTVDGKPVTAGQVTYVPMDTTKSDFGGPAGPIDSSGQYTLTTAGHPGAPLGKYKVTVAMSANMTPTPGATTMPQAQFGPQYADPARTPLTKEVVNSPAPGQYDLQLTK